MAIKTKTLLINPHLLVSKQDPSGISLPLGLAYLASYLRENNFPVDIVDCAAEGAEKKVSRGQYIRLGLAEEEIIKRVKSFNPRITGISCQSTLHAKEAHQVAALVKKANSKILVVMGGAHPSAAPEEVLADKNVDVVVRGEGEETLLELVKMVEKGADLTKVKGVSWKKNNRIVHNPPRPLIKDLGCLPFPARDLLRVEIYQNENGRKVSYTMKKKVFGMVSSRGCPGKCIYCAVWAVWGRAWRGRSAVNVVDEIEALIKEYQAEEIHFLDDSLSVDQQRLEEICDEIIRRKIKIKWATPNGIAVWLLNRKLLRKMKQAGCYRLTFGLESGSKEILKGFIGKDYDYSQARKTIAYASRLGLWTIGTFIIGFPEETREQIEETINYAISTDLNFAIFYLANPFPGTPMYDIYRDEGLLPAEGAYEIVRGCKSKHFSHSQLISMQSEAQARFLKSRYLRPGLIVSKLKSPDDWLYLARLGVNFSKMAAGGAFKNRGIASLWK